LIVLHCLFCSQIDDFDLNEIFAEYFINEFDDPLNAYTSSMANYSSGNAVNINLPSSSSYDALMNLDPNPSTSAPPPFQYQNNHGLPTGGIRTVFHSSVPDPMAPAQKKQRSEADMSTMVSDSATAQSMQSNAFVNNSNNNAPFPVDASMSVLSHPGMMEGSMTTASSSAAGAGGRMSLPVGVGIRLGGVGGIAPATAQSAPRLPPNTMAMWHPGGVVSQGVVSDQAIAERRQRNREHAKRSRVRKKFMLESLQEQVRGLQRENQNLRMLVQEHIPEHAMNIIAECCTTSPLFADPSDANYPSNVLGDTDKNLERADLALMQSLTMGQQCFVLSDPKLMDNPIVFASPGFYKLTGYTSEEVLGRNCRFLQGPGTDMQAVDVIRKAIATGSDATVCLLNYKADGTPFWNQFFVAALRDSDNCIVNYVRTHRLLGSCAFVILQCVYFLTLDLNFDRWVCNVK
jgi:PAS domain S-box-containing protein